MRRVGAKACWGLAVGITVNVACSAERTPEGMPGSGGEMSLPSSDGPGAGGSATGASTSAGGSVLGTGGETPLGGSSHYGGAAQSCTTPGNCPCTVENRVAIPLDLFDWPYGELNIHRFGERFVIVNDDITVDGESPETASSGTGVAVVSWQGVETIETHSWRDYCATTGCYYHASTVVAMEAGGYQVVFIERGGPEVGEPLEQYGMHAVTRAAKTQELVSSHLFNTDWDGRTVRHSLATSLDGRRTLFTLGNIDGGAGVAALGQDATVVGTPLRLNLGYRDNCSLVVPTEEGGLMSLVWHESDTQVVWQLRELDGDGVVVFERDIPLSMGSDLEFDGCPTIVVGPTDYFGTWTRLYGKTMLTTVARDSSADDPPDVLELPEDSPREFQGLLGDELLFIGPEPDGTYSVKRLALDGAPGGPGYPVPPFVPGGQTAPKVFAAQGRSFFLSYGTESTLTIEEVECL